MSFEVSHPEVLDVVRRALAEDIGAGDVTSNLVIGKDQRATGTFVAREPMVLAGVELLEPIYRDRGGVDDLIVMHPSGASIEENFQIARVNGRARTLLECERVALNFLQRLSGIATLAAEFAAAMKGTKCRVLDTRKTTPGLRRLEKMAAEAGGAQNHRMGLFDAILLKNNHVTAAGGIAAALERTKNAGMPVEIEVRTRQELDEALASGAKHLLLDNLMPEEAEEWIRAIDGRATVELSGGITPHTARAYAECGADFISAGAMTHSARAVDINFRLDWH
jgi:nicotinate-nucleotide pyrophosphorylase (carboxylating)